MPRSLFTGAKAGHPVPDTVASCPSFQSRPGGPTGANKTKNRLLEENHESIPYNPAQRQCRDRRRADFARTGRDAAPASRRAAEPIKIGFSMALTGPLAANGKQALLGAKIWQEEVNAKGGLLGRQVQLINYDDQSNPATVPGIYTKLLDVDKVDLVVGPYATNMVAPAIPVVMQKNKTFIGLFALDANSEFHYPKYFSMLPSGPDAEGGLHRRLLPGRGRRKIRSRRPSRSPPRTPSSRATPPKAPATTSRNTASRSSTTKPIRRTRPTSRRSSAPSRRPIRISWSSARIR